MSSYIREAQDQYELVVDFSVYGDGSGEEVQFTSKSLSEIYYYIKLREMDVPIELKWKGVK